MRTRLSKFAPKFASTPIRSSVSLGSMKRDNSLLGSIRPTTLTSTSLAKSNSMESGTTASDNFNRRRPLSGIYSTQIDLGIPRRMPTTTLIPLASPARSTNRVILSNNSENDARCLTKPLSPTYLHKKSEEIIILNEDLKGRKFLQF